MKSFLRLLVLLSLFLGLIGFASCTRSDERNENNNNNNVEEEVKQSKFRVSELQLRADYPQYNIGKIAWSANGGYDVGQFVNMTKSTSSSVSVWYSVEQEVASRQMAVEQIERNDMGIIKDAFDNSEYADESKWSVEKIVIESRFDGEEVEQVYAMELNSKEDSSKKADVFFDAEKGEIVYAKEDSITAGDKEEVEEDRLVINDALKSAVRAIYPTAKIIDAEQDGDFIEVMIFMSGNRDISEVELLFSTSYLFQQQAYNTTFGKLSSEYAIVKAWFENDRNLHPVPPTTTKVDVVEAAGGKQIAGERINYSRKIEMEYDGAEDYALVFYLDLQDAILKVEHGDVINTWKHFRETTANSLNKHNKVYDFTPAPGQFINERAEYDNFEDAAFKNSGTLGGFGGYIVVGFDHSIPNLQALNDSELEYDFHIRGNPFPGGSEPGIVFVMQDENGNGKPDDIWYELKGSEYGLEGTIQDYEVTYYKPADRSPVRWTDNLGNEGEIDYLEEFHTQRTYYPTWIKEDSYTLKGVRLESNTVYYPNPVDQILWRNNDYEWGYADNYGSDRTKDGNGFKISNAVDSEGNDANLKFIDFVKVQNAVNDKAGWLGEVSTEVLYFKDGHMLD